MDQPTKKCSTCGRDIPLTNHVVHEVNCQRNQTRCPECNEMVHRSQLSEHVEREHATFECKCGQRILKKDTANHTNSCPRRMAVCVFCELDIEQGQREEHERSCGSKTDECPKCNTRVILREMAAHMSICSGRVQVSPSVSPDSSEGSSSPPSDSDDEELDPNILENFTKLLQGLGSSTSRHEREITEIIDYILAAPGLPQDYRERFIDEILNPSPDPPSDRTSTPPQATAPVQTPPTPPQANAPIHSPPPVIASASASTYDSPFSDATPVANVSPFSDAVPISEPLSTDLNANKSLQNVDLIPRSQLDEGLCEQLRQYPLPTPFSSFTSWSELTQPIPTAHERNEFRFTNFLTSKSMIHSKRHSLFRRKAERNSEHQEIQQPDEKELITEISQDCDLALNQADIEIEPLFAPLAPLEGEMLHSVTQMALTKTRTHHQESTTKCKRCGVDLISSFIARHTKHCYESENDVEGKKMAETLRNQYKRHERK